MEKLYCYEVEMECGCCSDILLFTSDEKAQMAITETGLCESITIVDNAGVIHTELNTYAGIRNVETGEQLYQIPDYLNYRIH